MQIELRPCRLYLPGGLLGKRKGQEVHHSPRFCLWGTLPVAFTSAGVNVDDPFFPETKGDRTDRWAENLDDGNVCQETFFENLSGYKFALPTEHFGIWRRATKPSWIWVPRAV